MSIPSAKIVEKQIGIEDSLVSGAKYVAIAGVIASGAFLLKENNANIIKHLEKGVKAFNKPISKKTEFDKILEGKRDKEGVKIYDSFIAKKKQDSLIDKILNGSINITSPQAFKHIIKNSATLQRTFNAA